MCRLLLILAKEKIDPGWIDAFRTLSFKGRVPIGSSPGHLDGWGLAWFKPSHGWKLRKEASDPRSSSFLRAAETMNMDVPNLIIAHLRKASPGIGTTIWNTQPYEKNGWIFAHNGTIQLPNRIPLSHFSPVGNSDSERFFLFLLEKLERSHGSLTSGLLKEALLEIESLCAYSALNFLLSDGHAVFVHCRFSNVQEAEYYTLWSFEGSGLWAICSEPILKLPWKPLPNGALLFRGCG